LNLPLDSGNEIFKLLPAQSGDMADPMSAPRRTMQERQPLDIRIGIDALLPRRPRRVYNTVSTLPYAKHVRGQARPF